MHQNPPLIGISPRILRQVPRELGFRGKTLQYLEQSVTQWAMGCGGIVVMLPTVQREGTIDHREIHVDDYALRCDGLILQGGADLDPASYGEVPRACNGELDSIRDQFELALVRAFVERGKPVLGLCRGMQLINVAFGGSLYQDLLADGATTQNHVDADAYDQHGHLIHLTPAGSFQRWHQTAQARVNSIHHQGIKTLAAGFVVEAHAEDGVIEAIRRQGEAFVVGVQWHPEFHWQTDATLLSPIPLMRAFLEAAAKPG
ncbi:MAG: peptidase C26 [Lysobacterales bacterium CG02_land_8_20_14_3_00_62_12]|nr:MAG: peptidase C26 [Xanthomonadales bacterium CG02_land_8_20_14_3_00_62_12]PJA41520.1 MAG: peptidase C26 [Xanthomonadales bacterium CG_4_9_14_3_um_filter_62_6]